MAVLHFNSSHLLVLSLVFMSLAFYSADATSCGSTHDQKPGPPTNYGYGRKLREYVAPKPDSSKPYVALPKPLPKPEPYSIKSLTYSTQGIQGYIYCKSGAKLTPLKVLLQGVTCIASDPYDNKAPFSTLSPETNDKGYFLATLPLKVKGSLKLIKCKTFLYSSPSETCNIPIVIAKGDYQVPSACKVVPESKMNLCSVGPYAYTSPAAYKHANHAPPLLESKWKRSGRVILLYL